MSTHERVDIDRTDKSDSSIPSGVEPSSAGTEQAETIALAATPTLNADEAALLKDGAQRERVGGDEEATAAAFDGRIHPSANEVANRMGLKPPAGNSTLYTRGDTVARLVTPNDPAGNYYDAKGTDPVETIIMMSRDNGAVDYKGPKQKADLQKCVDAMAGIIGKEGAAQAKEYLGKVFRLLNGISAQEAEQFDFKMIQVGKNAFFGIDVQPPTRNTPYPSIAVSLIFSSQNLASADKTQLVALKQKQPHLSEGAE